MNLLIYVLLLLSTHATRDASRLRHSRRPRPNLNPPSRLLRDLRSAPGQETMVDDEDSDGTLGSKLGDECIICRDEINDNLEGVFTGCGERHGPIHRACREECIRTHIGQNRHPSCPICRRAIRLRLHENTLEVRPEPSSLMISVTQTLRSLFGGAHGLFMGAVVGVAVPMGLQFVGVIVVTIILIIFVILAGLAAACAGAGGGDCNGDCGSCDCGDCSCCDCGACDGTAASDGCLFYHGPCPYDPCWGYYGYGCDCNCDCNCNYRRTWRLGSAEEWFEIASQFLFIPGVCLGIFIGVKSGLFMLGFDVMNSELNAVESIFQSTTSRAGFLAQPAITSAMPPTLALPMPPTTTHALPTFPKLVNLPGFLTN